MLTKTCPQCRSEFTVTDEDLAFYDKVAPVFNGKKIDIPPPSLCPQCRWQRRLTFRNERKLYYRKCDLTGKSMVSMYPADAKFPVYYIKDWLGDGWDPLKYGRDFDFSRPFFEQFQEIANEVPHLSLFIDPALDLNSEFTNCASESKNCYMISQAEKNEDCYYSRGINKSRDCCDCLRINDCELCYEAINASNCYGCAFIQDCADSTNCYFSSELRSCKNCFGCHGLVQKEYYIFNQPSTKEEFEKMMSELTLTPSKITEIKAKSAALRLETPQRFARLIQCENSTGDHLIQCKNARSCFDSKNLEDCAYCQELLNGAKDCQDFSMFGDNCELLYECTGCGLNVNHCLFTSHCWENVSELIYCDCCYPSVKNCFGCFGLHHNKQYCILNKQYTKEEYEALVPKIIEHMKSTGEFGEMFPIQLSSFAYNESLGQQFFPLIKEQVEANGWRWKDDEPEQSYTGPRITPPETIDMTTDDMCQQVLTCQSTGKPYKIIPQELKFYRRMKLPVPLLSPEERHRIRMSLRNPRKLWSRTCAKCSAPISTTYAPDRPETVYCEKCYLETVY